MKKNIVVSFTSYPPRIQTINTVLDSIINQTILPTKILLYLSICEFGTKVSFPYLEKYKKYGFEIRWVQENLKSHKKYFYAMQEYPEDIVITIDDDVIYGKTMIEELIKGHLKHKNAIIARRVHMITWKDKENIETYENWCGECINYFNEPRMDFVAVGVDGILYPPGSLPGQAFDKENILKYCYNADDLWLKGMELINQVPVMLVKKEQEDIYLKQYIQNGLYQEYNGNGGNDKQFKDVLDIVNHIIDVKQIIQKKGIFMQKDISKIREKGTIKIIDALIEDISKTEGILIYGSGYVAGLLYSILDVYELKDKIKGFIVTNKENNPDYFHRIKVLEFKEYDNNNKWGIYLALMPDKQEEVYNYLLVSGVEPKIIRRLVNTDIFALKDCEKIFFDSAKYWNNRYRNGGNSGFGSYNRLAEFKAEIINSFIETEGIETVIEWGCGDGNQLALANYPKYLGYDVSEEAIKICKKKYKGDETKQFMHCGNKTFKSIKKADLVISLDVIYHLIEDDIYELYMHRLFASSKKYVCIYSCNFDKEIGLHVKARKFTDYVETNFKQWKLVKFIANRYPYDENNFESTSWSDFYFYEKQ